LILTLGAPFSAFFSETNVMIKILPYLALFLVKNANYFSEFFGENILKIVTSVPGLFRRVCELICKAQAHGRKSRAIMSGPSGRGTGLLS
jgi:hypothetical protein